MGSIVLPGETVKAKMDKRTRELLIGYADQYETQDFLNGDPSWFMHQVVGVPDQEVMAFLASCLSYGSRSQFFPKIQFMLDESHEKVYDWVRQGAYQDAIPDTDACYYRLYTCHHIRCLLAALQAMLTEYGTIGAYVRQAIARQDGSLMGVKRLFPKPGNQRYGSPACLFFVQATLHVPQVDGQGWVAR